MESEHKGTPPSRPRPSVIGPVILILAGLLLLLSNLGILSWSLWELLWRLWPVGLVAVGLDMLIGRRTSWGGWVVLAVTLVLVAVSIWFMNTWPMGSDFETVRPFRHPFWGPGRWW